MGLLYLVRHALTRQDPTRHMAEWDLDPVGAADLARLANLPCWAGAGRILSSTEPKAILTAEAIRAQHGGLPATEQYADLCELRKAGWVGDRHDAVMAEVFAAPGQPALPGWETGAHALERFSRCVEGLLSNQGELILVSHATVLSLYLANLLGQDRVRFHDWRSIGFPDYAVVDVAARRVLQPFGAW